MVLAPLPIDFEKPGQGTIVCPFHGIREQAGWQLPVAPMVLEAFAAEALAAAGLVTAIAPAQILVLIAFSHEIVLGTALLYYRLPKNEKYK